MMTPEELITALRRPLEDVPGDLRLCPVPGAFEAVVRPPGSKSLTNRALLLAALAEGESVLSDCLLDADDARVMIAALRELGAEMQIAETSDAGNTVRVRGVGGRFRGGCALNLNNAGTATRFLAAAACLADGPVVIDGNARMRQRPIRELLVMLRSLGVRIDELGEVGCVPIRVQPCRLEGGVLEVGTTQSSQYISAVMMLAPWTAKGIEIRFAGPVTSPSYIEMTQGLMGKSGGGYRSEGGVAGGVLRCPASAGYRFGAYHIEPDASGASYFWAAGALVPGSRVTVGGVNRESLQGDARFARDVMGSVGAGCDEHHGGIGVSHRRLLGTDVDLSTMPDTAMTAAAVACFAEGPTTLRGLRTLRVKETDRLAALRNELTKIGVGVEIESYAGGGGVRDELLRIVPPEGGVDCSGRVPDVAFDTYDDHRMAMSLAIIGLRRPNVVIRDPKCVAKTYPGFWKDWAGLYEKAMRDWASRDRGVRGTGGT